METTIYFASAGEARLSLRVAEDPNHVYEALTAAAGLPFLLVTREGGRVYVNPGTIAYWQESPSGSASFS